MGSIGQDFRYAFRTLAKDRTFALVAVLTLACVLGANTAIFSAVNAILLRPLAFPDGDSLVILTSRNIIKGTQQNEASYPNLLDISAQAKTLTGAGAYREALTFIMEGDDPPLIHGAQVSANVFSILGVKPELGRTFNAEEDRVNGTPALVISHELWQKRFGGASNIVGRVIRFGSSAKPRTVVGVMPRGFKFPVSSPVVDFWSPINLDAPREVMDERGLSFVTAVARLAPGATLQTANGELDTISRRLEAQYPNTNTGRRFGVAEFREQLVATSRPVLLLLLAAVATVLMIGCANIANLLLARATGRHREISIRTAVGASRSRIVRQLLIESVLLSVIAGALGLLLASWGVDALVALAPPDIPRLETISIDAAVLGYTLAFSLLTGVFFGLAPAIAASKTNLTDALKEGARGTTEGKGGRRLRGAFVIAQVALSIVLIVSAGLLIRSFVMLSTVDAGFDPHGVTVMTVSPRKVTYPTDAENIAFQQRFVAELRKLPGVESASAVNDIPLGGDESILTFGIEGQPDRPPGNRPNATILVTAPGYFHTLRIPIRRGRDFTEGDRADSPLVVLVNESFARRWLGPNPLSQRITLGDHRPRQIVGIVGDIRFQELAGKPTPAYFIPHTQTDASGMNFLVRSANGQTAGPALRAALKRLDPGQPVVRITTFDQVRAESLGRQRFTLTLISTLAVLALILAAVGIYSIMSYTVTQRIPEIGIRMSLGAQARDIFRLVLGQSLRLVGVGVAAGVACALATTRIMSTLLYGVTPSDPMTFGAICVLIIAVALLATFIPASRATRVDPLVAIRYD
jgi:putative ABC transport system permease protein